MASADGSSSILISTYVTPRCFRKYFARRQSGHQCVVYIVTGSIVGVSSRRARRAACVPPECGSVSVAARRPRAPNPHLDHLLRRPAALRRASWLPQPAPHRFLPVVPPFPPAPSRGLPELPQSH